MDGRMMDHPGGYGVVSRFLHWLMALMILWQAISAMLRFFADDTPVANFFFAAHYTNGFSIFCLAILRGAWGLVNVKRRPAYRTGVDHLAVFGHVAMYALMILVPAVALVRAYGSDRGFSVFGIELFAPRATEIEWMTALGGQFHGLLGWILLALIVGHIVMALVHTYVWKQPMIARMTRGSGHV